MATTKISPAQRKYLLALLTDRELPANFPEESVWKSLRISEDPEEFGMGKQDASRLIDILSRQPVKKRTGEGPTEHLTPGVYEKDGEVFVVKPNRAKDRMYAKRLVETSSPRLTATDEHVKIDFVYAPGVVMRLTPADKMPLERAKALTIRYGRCIACGRNLKVAQSVERGIGPVCVKSFA